MEVFFSGAAGGSQAAMTSGSPIRLCMRLQVVAATAWLFRGGAVARSEAERESGAYEGLAFVNLIESAPWAKPSTARRRRRLHDDSSEFVQLHSAELLDRVLFWTLFAFVAGQIIRLLFTFIHKILQRRRAEAKKAESRIANETPSEVWNATPRASGGAVKGGNRKREVECTPATLYFPRMELAVVTLVAIPCTLASLAVMAELGCCASTMSEKHRNGLAHFEAAIGLLVAAIAVFASALIAVMTLRLARFESRRNEEAGKWVSLSERRLADLEPNVRWLAVNFVERFGAPIETLRGISLTNHQLHVYFPAISLLLQIGAAAACAIGGVPGMQDPVARARAGAVAASAFLALDATLCVILHPYQRFVSNVGQPLSSALASGGFAALAMSMRGSGGVELQVPPERAMQLAEGLHITAVAALVLTEVVIVVLGIVEHFEHRRKKTVLEKSMFLFTPADSPMHPYTPRTEAKVNELNTARRHAREQTGYTPREMSRTESGQRSRAFVFGSGSGSGVLGKEEISKV